MDFPFLSNDEEESNNQPREKEVTSIVDVTRPFDVFRVEINYGDRERVERVTKYRHDDDTLKLYDQEPKLSLSYKRGHRTRDIYSRLRNQLYDGEPLSSARNVEDINITLDGEYVFVCEDVEVTEVLRRDSPDDEWETAYKTFGEWGDEDEHDIIEWMRYEWEAHKDD
jgi:hypothetical protein